MIVLVQLGTYLEIVNVTNFLYIIVGVREYFIQIIFKKWEEKMHKSGLYLWSLEIEDSVGEIIKRNGEVNLYR